jgi:aminopeptidase N
MPIKNNFRFLVIFFLFTVCAFQNFAQPARPNYNRVRTYDVQHYIIRVSFDSDNKIVIGDTTIKLKPLQNNFNRIELDAAEMKFDSVRLETENKELVYRVSGEKIYLDLSRNYSPDDLISIRFKYSAKPRKGVYFVSKDAENDGVEHPAQIWTQGEPEEAHYWFPSYDFPDDKATSEQFITVAKNETAIGNGNLLGTKINSDGTKTFHYKMPVPHSTYLTSFVVGEYKKFNDSYKNIPLGFFTYPNREAIAQKSLSQTKEMMRVFEELTRINFPFNKYDQTVVAKFNFGGMENITATTMSDTEMFLNKPNEVEDLISHELAHSWFGNLVTCRNWAELWLNEGFATYMEAAWREKKYGRSDYLRKLREDFEMFEIDYAVNSRHALFNPYARPDKSIFSVTNYNKGSVVIHTLRETVGTENFWKAINVYLSRHKFQNVETPNLQNAMEEVSGMDLDWFFKQWVYSGGYPKLRVKSIYDAQTGRLEITVRQTQTADKLTPEAFVLPMEIEIKTEKGEKVEKIVIKNREETFSIQIDEKPLKITFDKDEKILLKSVKFEKLETIN